MHPIATICRSVKPSRKRVVHFGLPGFLARHHLSTSSGIRSLPSSANFEGFAKSVLSKIPHVIDGRNIEVPPDSTLKGAVFDVLDVVPDVARRLLRADVVKPEDVLELLLGFQSECRNGAVDGKKIGSLWEIFRLCSKQRGGFEFEHLPPAYEIMASLLTEVGMYGEAELCLGDIERRGVQLVNHAIFSDLIRANVAVGAWERSVHLFDQMRSRGFLPAASCYGLLINLLVKKDESRIALRICYDMLEQDVHLSDGMKVGISNVVDLLCRDARIQEARNLVKRAARFGYVPCSLAADGIFRGYCERRDFEDLVSFSVEFKCPPDVKAGNKIIHTLCSNFGSDRANQFRLELERVGFKPDEISFGILIGWCCRERNLKRALLHISEMLEKGLRPDLFTYNALVGGVFREGMWKHARHIIDEMTGGGIEPDLSTYKILMAGYSRERQFDEVRTVVGDILKLRLIDLSSTEDPMCKAFSLLGFDPQAVRLKRDGDVGLSRTEFYDTLGNGLYLDTDVDEFDRRIDKILKGSALPDFNSLIMEKSGGGYLKYALRLVDETFRWGQGLSPIALSTLMKSLCLSRFSIRAIIRLLAKMPKYVNHMDKETLNLLLQLYTSKGLLMKALNLLEQMADGHLTIRCETYTRFIKCLCKKGNVMEVLGFLRLVRKFKWGLQAKDFEALIGCLCQKRLVSKAVELFEDLQMISPNSHMCHMFIEKLCDAGFASIAYCVVEEMQQRDRFLENQAYNHLIRGFCQKEDHIKALQIYDDMQSKKMVPCVEVWVEMIPFLLMAGRFVEASLLKDAVIRDHPNLQSSVDFSLLRGYCMVNMWGDAASLFRNILSRKTALRTKAFDMILRAIDHLGDVTKAESLLGVMIREDFPLSISSFRIMARLICTGGRILHVLSLKEIILRENLCDNDIVIYNILIFIASSTGNTLLVKKILDEMQNRELALTEASYNFLTYGFSCCKDSSRARHYLSDMVAKKMKPSNRSLRSIIYCLNNSAEIGEVMEILRELESRGWLNKPTVQNAMLSVLVAHGMFLEAEEFVDRTVERGLVPDGIIYDSLIRELCARGKPNKALHLLNIMLRKKGIPSTSCYSALVCGFSRQHEMEKAMDIHAEMMFRDFNPSFEVCDALIKECCEVGRIGEAEKLLMSMIRAGEKPSREMFCHVINRYRLENNSRKASDLMKVMQRSGYEPEFEMQWSIISTLKGLGDKSNGNRSKGFLSRILSGSGFL